MMNGALADLRFAARKLSRAPGFTIPTILILGLGIGANSTIFTRGLRLAGTGIILGLVGTWLAAGPVRSFLFGISPHDLTTRRATRVDPLTALRYE